MVKNKMSKLIKIKYLNSNKTSIKISRNKLLKTEVVFPKTVLNPV